MAKFSVYPNLEGGGYLIDVQADLMRHLNTRMVIPLLPLDVAPKPAKTLNPLFDISGRRTPW
jgi:toxin CcdB